MSLADGAISTQAYLFLGGTKGGSGVHGFAIKNLDNFRRDLVNGHQTMTVCVQTYNEEFCEDNDKPKIDEHNFADSFWALTSF